ncbi:MAG: hypothetical protein M9920_05600 [Verrucomicrobiae bacterium]|nr:hypothetical protein [Verrucomicrobiae bacterium]
MAAFAERFEKAFKPAIKKWCLAYQGRIPFKLEAVTPDKFHSRLAGGLYTFMIDGTTLTISDSKQGTRVFYMMTQEAAHDLNTIGVHNGPRNLTVPVTREEVLRMVKADTGVDFQPNQVEIKPTAAACAVDGGAFVEVGRQVLGDLEIMTGTNISFVVAADGKLICYQH